MKKNSKRNKDSNKEKKTISHEQIQMTNEKLFEYIQNQKFGSIEEINAFLEKNVTGKRIDEVVPPKEGKKSKKEKSDDLMFEAYESEPSKGVKLAKEALEIYPQNIRALIYLADKKQTPREAIGLYKKALKIAETEFGQDFFEKNKGHFWGLHETRPYMTAKLNVAECWYAMDNIDQAIKDFRELLELNPNDNQGVRYLLSSLLLENRNYSEFHTLYKQYPDEASTFWYFNYALFLFITEGDTEKANSALEKAHKQNKHVLQVLTARKKMVLHDSDFYSPGDESEAREYVTYSIKVWYETEGAIEWIKDFLQE